MHKIFKLSNGIRVVTETTDYVKSVSAGVWIGAGSSCERRENNGVSHFIEHMLFKGTKTRTAKEIAEYMDAVGGQLNAMTAREYTCYYAKTLSENMDMAFEILSDMLINSTFSEENIATERKVILEEISMGEDDPEDYIHDVFCENMWKGEALGFPIAGTAETLSGIGRSDILDYFSDMYTAENIVISVVGNFDEREALEILEEKFGRIKASGFVYEPQNRIAVNRGIKVVKRDIEQCQLCIGFEGFPRAEQRTYDLAVVNALFGGNMSSRLFQKVREEAGLAYSVYSYTSSYRNNGSMTVYAGLNTEELSRAMEIINKEIKILKRDKLSKREVEMAKNQLKASVVMGSEGCSSRMSSYGKCVLFEDKVKTLDDLTEMIDRVDCERVAEVIDEVFDRDKLVIAALGKLEGDGKELLDIMDF